MGTGVEATLSPTAESGGETTFTLRGILRTAGTTEREVYFLVRSALDDLEQAAPWDLLYFLPDSPSGLVSVLHALRQAVDDIPRRVDELLGRLGKDAGEEDEELEEIGFFFSGIHEMVSHDLLQLQEKMKDHLDGSRPPSLAEQMELCEIGADLKGKYASAMMGVAASLLSREVADVQELEPVLFPEKAEEYARNDRLVDDLSELVETLRVLTSEMPFSEILDRWRQGLRADPYALADLAFLQGRLRRLLQSRNRRALYSGDYQRIKRREAELSARLVAIEALQHKTWQPEGLETGEEGSVYESLVQYLLELAAIVDANILKEVLGAGEVGGLRGGARTGAGGSGHLEDTDSRAAVSSLLAEEDLKTFFDFLVGVVRKRSSFVRSEIQPAAKEPEPVTPEPGRSERASTLGPPPLSVKEAPAQLLALGRQLTEICGSDNGRWNSFRMVHRLLTKHARVPPSMVLAAGPFLDELRARVAPQLEDLATGSALDRRILDQLRTSLLTLRSSKLSSEQQPDESGVVIERVMTTIEQLRTLGGATSALEG